MRRWQRSKLAVFACVAILGQIAMIRHPDDAGVIFISLAAVGSAYVLGQAWVDGKKKEGDE